MERPNFGRCGRCAIILFPLYALASTVATAAVLDQAFTSPGNGYTVRFPADWKRVPDEDVRTASASLAKIPNAQNVSWEAVYQAPKAAASFRYPYVILQVTSYGGGQIDDAGVEAAVKAMGDIKKIPRTGDESVDKVLASPDAFKTPQYDATNHVVYQPIEMNVAGVGPVSGLAVGHFGRNAMVMVMCYDRAADFEKSRPTFNQIAASFQFDPSATFQPHNAFLSGVGKGAINGAVIGALGGALVGVFAMLKHRKKSGPPPVPPGA